MSKEKYFFVKSTYVGTRMRIQPMSNQTFADGTEVDPTFNVQCAKDVRAEFPLGTIFLCKELMKGATFYTVPGGDIFAVSVPPTGAPPKDAQAWAVDAYAAFKVATGGFADEADTVYAEKEKPAKPSAPTFLEKLQKNPALAPPRPEKTGFYVDPHIWWMLVRNVLQGENTMLVGPTGTGKTEVVTHLTEALKYGMEIHDMGAMHEPISGLLGTHRLKGGASIFDYAKFTKDIQKPKTVIVLDELSRAPLTANNILFPCLDSRRELPIALADADGARNIPVNESTVFFATANIGVEYSGTQALDRALVDRFTIIEMSYPPQSIEEGLLCDRIGIDRKQATHVVRIANAIRNAAANDDLSSAVSVRYTLRAAALIKDGFDVVRALQSTFLPLFEGTASDGERSTVTNLISAR